MLGDLSTFPLEAARLAALRRYAVLGTPPEAAFDRAVQVAAQVYGVPIALVSLVDVRRQWFKACYGVDMRETDRSISMCTHALEHDGVLIVPDTTLDERFAQNPLVTGPLHIRFYAGAPLVTPDGHKVGTLCILDTVPRPSLTPEQTATLQALADGVVSELELRCALAEQARERHVHTAVVKASLDAMVIVDHDGCVLEWNPSAEQLLGYNREDVLGADLMRLIVPPGDYNRHKLGVAQLGQEQTAGQRRIELPILRRGGETLHCEYTVTSFYVDDEQLFTVYIRDLTEVRAAREAMKASYSLLRAVVDSVPETIFVKNLERQYVMMNTTGAARLGQPMEAILGRTDEDFFPASMAARRQRDEAVLETGTPMVTEFTEKFPDGTYRHFWTSKDVYRDPSGNAAGLIGAAFDITQRKQDEAIIRGYNQTLRDQVEAAQFEILARLARAAEYRDDDTGEHMNRVAMTAAGIARELNLPDETVALIGRAAPMHDVGKIGISDSILLKPGRLTPEEFELVKAHTTIGASILEGGNSPLVMVAEEIARTHHERWDGTGYPAGLAGETIPITGRIVAVADVLDALTSERPYKQAWSFEAAMTEIRTQAGRQFDPAVIAALERLTCAHQQD
ncbi:HD domain-containing phosphohydrolase [Deinococcus hopiensis]|uniref:Putative two-component system response regulator n=1 Tax=Deinococcus hopiensis KR-140 TaxID=695939 RepID=A0A1W1VWC4_9DEIO|nr:HD domain-containing phosphohydrolase [Deinococcus hopiensis]SMB97628.1 putative two-component system response regulator [Deinococcus hopiensis KR-140]